MIRMAWWDPLKDTETARVDAAIGTEDEAEWQPIGSVDTEGVMPQALRLTDEMGREAIYVKEVQNS